MTRIETGRWLSRRRYTPTRAANALTMLLQKDSTYLQRARMVKAQIAQEDGVANLCNAIEFLPVIAKQVSAASLVR